MSTVAMAVRAPVTVSRRIGASVVFAALGLLMVFVFASGRASGHDSRFGLSHGSTWLKVPDLVVPAAGTSMVLGIVCLAFAVAQASRTFSRRAQNWMIAIVLVLFVFSFLCWAAAGQSMSLVGLAGSSVARATPLVLGALAGVLCERSGVINIAIEGQFLFGAFAGAVVASAFASVWLGLISAALAGALLGLILAVFAIKYFVNQVILGVVLNVFALGLTGFLYDRVLIPHLNTLNQPPTFRAVNVPVLSEIPILGEALFQSNAIVYIAIVALIGVHVGLFHTRWGLRTRAVGEHPAAADTVGIKVLATRYRNVVMAGLIAGIGGAYLSIGSVGGFGKSVSSGKGFIALAAVIFGRWSPMGALGAALLFGFADALQNILQILQTPIPSNFLLMAPYLATLLAVAGLVGMVRPPKADGEPYVKS